MHTNSTCSLNIQYSVRVLEWCAVWFILNIKPVQNVQNVTECGVLYGSFLTLSLYRMFRMLQNVVCCNVQNVTECGVLYGSF